MRIFSILLLSGILFQSIYADMIDSKIINLIGESSYNRNKNYINKLFMNKNSFYENGYLNMYKVISLLQNNGLLNLKFGKPQELNVIFISQTSPIFLIKSINRALSHMGYSYWTPSEVVYEEETSKLKISLITEHIIDPILLLNELSKSGFALVDINQISNVEWEYNLALINSKMPNSTFVAKGNSLNIYEVSGEYWIEVGNSGRLEISSLNNKSFNPKIISFDRNLNIIDIQELSRRSNANVNIVDNTKFIQIKDSIFAGNIKNGINVRLR